MAESFRVGEIAIFSPPRDVRSSLADAKCKVARGSEVTIVCGLRYLRLMAGEKEFGTMYAYTIEGPNGVRGGCPPEWLRKRPPKQANETLDTVNPLKVVRWSECPWRPAGVRA
jgi:hypothetical protein